MSFFISIIRALLGHRCSECKSRIKGKKFSGLGPGSLCELCFSNLEAQRKNWEVLDEQRRRRTTLASRAMSPTTPIEPSARHQSRSSIAVRDDLEELARRAWKTVETLKYDRFTLESTRLPTSPTSMIESILNHARRVAPGFDVPHRAPLITSGALIDAAGQFTESDGWVSVKVGNSFLLDRKAFKSILAHEACHYILGNSGIRRLDLLENERLTDLCMFVCGLGTIFLEGYKKDVTGEYRDGHRLGYLTDEEYSFAAQYVLELRSDNVLRLPSVLDELKKRLANVVWDSAARERLIRDARSKHPLFTETEIYELVIEQAAR